MVSSRRDCIKTTASKKKIDTLLSTIEKDERVTALGFYGSYARGNATSKSDIDLFVVLRQDALLVAIEGVHYQSRIEQDIDFLLIPEQMLHENRLPTYHKECILSCNAIHSARCSICHAALQAMRSPNLHLILSEDERENIYWHLRNIIHKAQQFEEGSVARIILFSKLVYFLALLWERFSEQIVTGELSCVYGKDNELRSFLTENGGSVPHIEVWEKILNHIPALSTVREQTLYKEIDNLIQPYTPPLGSVKAYYGKAIVASWMTDDK